MRCGHRELMREYNRASSPIVRRPVYTVGNEQNYDLNIALYGAGFKKVGHRPNYPGGFACKTPEDAARLIAERGYRGAWAVYELAADWEADTAPSENGWWHALINDARILRKVSL